jgi:SAM-dependent MidA family methyltransferase
MLPIELLLRDRIALEGPISFRDFMDVALYHPEHGYYTNPRDPFGRDGDFYTAQQLQPVFGILIAQCIRGLGVKTVIELGAGRGEMSPYFSEWNHIAVDAAWGELPETFEGAVFANELFDALPVHSIVRRGDQVLEQRISVEGDRFIWTDGEPVTLAMEEYLRRYGTPGGEGGRCEVNLDALETLNRIDRHMRNGFLLVIDYGYTTRELIRFPQGTLMSYRRHQALEDVLAAPGERDITAHVNFTALQQHAESLGWGAGPVRTRIGGRLPQ